MVSRGGEESLSIKCSHCGAQIEYLGQRIFGTEYGALSALFDVYVCNTCFTVQLISRDDHAYYNLIKGVGVGSTPKLFLKPCISCGSSIPIASEVCELCGAKQPPWDEAKKVGDLRHQLTGFGKKMSGRLVKETAPTIEDQSAIQPEAAPHAETEVKQGECMVCHGPIRKGISQPEYSAISEKANALSGKADDLRTKLRESDARYDTNRMTKKQHDKLVKKYLSQLFKVDRELLPLKERMQKEKGNADTEVVTCPHCGNMAHKTHMLEWLHVKGTCPVCHQRVTYS